MLVSVVSVRVVSHWSKLEDSGCGNTSLSPQYRDGTHPSFVFQQDGARSHTTKSTQEIVVAYAARLPSAAVSIENLCHRSQYNLLANSSSWLWHIFLSSPSHRLSIHVLGHVREPTTLGTQQPILVRTFWMMNSPPPTPETKRVHHKFLAKFRRRGLVSAYQLAIWRGVALGMSLFLWNQSDRQEEAYPTTRGRGKRDARGREDPLAWVNNHIFIQKAVDEANNESLPPSVQRKWGLPLAAERHANVISTQISSLLHVARVYELPRIVVATQAYRKSRVSNWPYFYPKQRTSCLPFSYSPFNILRCVFQFQFVQAFIWFRFKLRYTADAWRSTFAL